MVPLRRLVSSLLMFSLLVTALHGPLQVSAKNGNFDVPATTNEENGLQFRLSHGIDVPESRPATKLATTTELSQSETENVLRRLPPIKVDATDSQEFALREGSLPPPRTGNTIETSFPASTAAANEPVAAGPLQVLRYSPEGAVPAAPELSITFSQPMTALTSQEEAATNVPVKLNPQPAGKWRWLGTKTLIFQPDGRFPMATTYRVTVPAGTRAANGSPLTTEKSWSFTTPPLSVKTTYPSSENTQPRDAVMFIEFDQRIDPVAVLSAIRVSSGGRTLKTRLATSDEVKQAIARDENGTAALREAANDRWLAFRAIDPKTGQPDLALPSNARITVSLAPGAPSAEGPNRTRKSHDFSFRTYRPFEVTSHKCDGGCNRYDWFEIEFTNALADDFDESKIRVEPSLDSMEMSFYESRLEIKGLKQGNTTYRVTLDKSIKDRFNQTLSRDVILTFKAGPSPRRFVGPDDEFYVMDPAAPARCSVFTIDFTKLKVRIYSVTPDDWPRWIAYEREQGNPPPRTPPGRLVFSRTIPIRNVPNEIVETVVDLRPALTNGLGHMILIVEPFGGKRSEEDSDDPIIAKSWIQVTNIGLDVFLDRTDLVSWVTSLKDGAPLSNVDVTLFQAGIRAQSGSDGLARFALSSSHPVGPSYIVARRDGDVAILPESVESWSARPGTWTKQQAIDSLRWFVFDDRKMYQPGEDVHVKGWIRRVVGGKTGDTGLLGDGFTKVGYVLKDSRGNQVKIGSVPVNVFGGFDFAEKLPDKLNLGSTSLELEAPSSLDGHSHTHQFQVQEFRRPEFEVKTQTESEGPFFVGAGADVSLSATYYAGGGLADAPVKWSVQATPTRFTPPNRSDYVFGEWTPWWVHREWEYNYEGSTSQILSGVTDASGKHRLHIDFDRVNPARPSTVTASASVSDV
ncbi:MAG TPA: Ig-like domain-containing protein, partial [Pyrinomonadaceae bacterium]|nr:Ig-like domain-containing protein [Pyrinomonadaceae bacterium]